MAELKPIKVSKKNLDKLPVEDGQIIALSDENRLLYDMNGSRHEVSGGAAVSVFRTGPDEAHSEEIDLIATGAGAHAEGLGSSATGAGAHAEGCPSAQMASPSEYPTSASGKGAHAEGGGTNAIGDFSHSEGKLTTASGEGAHAEGLYTIASGKYSHAEGAGRVITRTMGATTFLPNKASGDYSHVGGSSCESSGLASFAHGKNCKAKGEASVALGWDMTNNASGGLSFGYYGTDTNDTDMALQIGCGEGTSSKQRANLLTVRYPSNTNKASYDNRGTLYGRYVDAQFGTMSVYSSDDIYASMEIGEVHFQRFLWLESSNIEGIITRTSYNILDNYGNITVNINKDRIRAPKFENTGTDYAEYIAPWYDNNVDNEDRIGYFVTVKNNQLYKAENINNVIGVTSGTYGLLGTGEPFGQWKGKYTKDNLGRLVVDGEGNLTISEQYDESLEYKERSNRPEWSPVGLMGQLHVYDDGTCQAGQYCKCGEKGIATLSAEEDTCQRWFVLERVSDNTIKILFK